MSSCRIIALTDGDYKSIPYANVYIEAHVRLINNSFHSLNEAYYVTMIGYV